MAGAEASMPKNSFTESRNEKRAAEDPIAVIERATMAIAANTATRRVKTERVSVKTYNFFDTPNISLSGHTSSLAHATKIDPKGCHGSQKNLKLYRREITIL